MMKILYICYSCSPYNGTEDKLGWNIPFEASKTNDVWIITKPDGKNDIDNFLSINQADINVIYVDIPSYWKKVFNGAFYSGRQNIWNRVVQKKVQQIVDDQAIEIIHQVNPVEFRSIGNYGVYGIPFVCGPVGGGEYMPASLLYFASNGLDKELIRWIANLYYKTKYKISGRLDNITALLFANEETRSFLVNDENYRVTTELGVTCDEFKTNVQKIQDKVVLISAGRLIYRKGINFLLAAISAIPDNYNFELIVLGDGPERKRLEKQIASNINLSKRVHLLGKVPHTQIGKYYENSSFFVMPSLRETTGSVILESLARGVPVITVRAYGAKNLLNNTNSVMYSVGNNPVFDLKNALIYAIEHVNDFNRNRIQEQAKRFLFEEKVKEYLKIYKEILGE